MKRQREEGRLQGKERERPGIGTPSPPYGGAGGRGRTTPLIATLIWTLGLQNCETFLFKPHSVWYFAKAATGHPCTGCTPSSPAVFFKPPLTEPTPKGSDLTHLEYGSGVGALNTPEGSPQPQPLASLLCFPLAISTCCLLCVGKASNSSGKCPAPSRVGTLQAVVLGRGGGLASRSVHLGTCEKCGSLTPRRTSRVRGAPSKRCVKEPS